MELYSESNNYKLYHGNMLDMLDVIEPNSIDSIVTDPPYELNFMNKGWDNAGISFQKETWEKCLTVLKPGGYLLVFGGSRTFHRIACAIEDAGFEIRDTIMWLYGSGFPKSMNISKGLEAKEKLGNSGTRNKRKIEQSCDGKEYNLRQTNNGVMGKVIETTRKEYKPSTELANKWYGWGTCLKPSFEPIIVARKPFKSSLVDNIIKYGVGGLNLDECRIGNQQRFSPSATIGKSGIYNWNTRTNENKDYKGKTVNGRFPANTILTYDETDFDEVCGGFPNTKSSYNKDSKHETEIHRDNADILKYGFKTRIDSSSYNDSGSASRYFYCAKASKRDRDEGLDFFSAKVDCDRNPKLESANVPMNRSNNPRKNTHPTVKPTSLMQYLVRLVTPNNGIIFDPFNGSGSTGKAVMYENYDHNKNYKYIGIEIADEYLKISKARIEYVCNLKGE